jgi:hypothetical protein
MPPNTNCMNILPAPGSTYASAEAVSPNTIAATIKSTAVIVRETISAYVPLPEAVAPGRIALHIGAATGARLGTAVLEYGLD